MSAGWDERELETWLQAVRDEQARRAADTPPTRAELHEAITYCNAAAKRHPAVIGTPAYPSRWDRAHAGINDLIDELVERFIGR